MSKKKEKKSWSSINPYTGEVSAFAILRRWLSHPKEKWPKNMGNTIEKIK